MLLLFFLLTLAFIHFQFYIYVLCAVSHTKCSLCVCIRQNNRIIRVNNILWRRQSQWRRKIVPENWEHANEEDNDYHRNAANAAPVDIEKKQEQKPTKWKWAKRFDKSLIGLWFECDQSACIRPNNTLVNERTNDLATAAVRAFSSVSDSDDISDEFLAAKYSTTNTLYDTSRRLHSFSFSQAFKCDKNLAFESNENKHTNKIKFFKLSLLSCARSRAIYDYKQ